MPARGMHAYKQAAAVAGGIRSSRRSLESTQNALEVGSTLQFTPITVCWNDMNYYVPVPKGLTGAAALNIMPDDAPEDVRGKKRLLHDITGVPRLLLRPYMERTRPLGHGRLVASGPL